MAQTDFKSIDEYIATFPVDTQKVLEEIRRIIHEAVPEAEETISYQIPCFKNGGPIVYFSAFQKHIALASPPPTMEFFKDELTAYKTSKSVVQLPYSQPLPKALITKIAKWREAENLKNKK